jgi:flagellar basal body rod protein FlgB
MASGITGGNCSSHNANIAAASTPKLKRSMFQFG